MLNRSGSRSSGLIHRRVPPAINDMSVSFERNDVREAPAVCEVGELFEISDSWDSTAAA
jgi:hypothetical protein